MMPVQDSLEEAEYRAAVDTVAAVIQGYLTEARGEPVDDFTFDTPFMDAGLDSLDMLKACLFPTSHALLAYTPCQKPQTFWCQHEGFCWMGRRGGGTGHSQSWRFCLVICNCQLCKRLAACFAVVSWWPLVLMG